MHIRSGLLVLAITVAVVGCSTPSTAPQPKASSFGSLASYPVPKGEGGGPELEYCFYYSKRMWELTSLIRENQISLQKAQEVTRASLGSQAIEEDLADLGSFATGSSVTPEQMAGERFIRCSKTLRLPVEARHLPIAQSCFGLLRLPRYVYGLKAGGQTAAQVKTALLAANPPAAAKVIGSTIDDVYATPSVDGFNALNRTVFLSCIAAGGNPPVGQR